MEMVLYYIKYCTNTRFYSIFLPAKAWLFSNLYQSGVSLIFSQELYQTGTYFPKTYNSMKDKISTKSKITFLKNIVRCPVFILLRFLFYSTPLCTTTHMWMHVCHIELLKQGEFHRSRIETWKKRNLQ